MAKTKLAIFPLLCFGEIVKKLPCARWKSNYVYIPVPSNLTVSNSFWKRTDSTDIIRIEHYLWLCESGAQVPVWTAALEPEPGRLELLDDVVRPLLVVVRADKEGVEQEVVVQSRGQHLWT